MCVVCYIHVARDSKRWLLLKQKTTNDHGEREKWKMGTKPNLNPYLSVASLPIHHVKNKTGESW